MTIVLYVTVTDNFNPTFTVAVPRLINRRRLRIRAGQAAGRPRQRRVPRSTGGRPVVSPNYPPG
jgi:hypothetical protein